MIAEYLRDLDFISKIGNHISDTYYDGYLHEVIPGSGYWKDDFGVIWNRNGADKDIGVIEGFAVTKPDITSYKFPVLDEVRLRKEYETLVSNRDETFNFSSIGFSMFERAGLSGGWRIC